jgi:hypothetical protein
MAVAGGAIGLIVVLAVALVVAIASSGSDEDGSSAEAAPQTFQGSPPEGFERPDPEVVEEFRACMEDQGVEVPEPGEAPPSDGDRLQEAFAACSDLLPEDIRPPGGAPGGSGPFIFPGDE